MCGRFSATFNHQDLAEIFKIIAGIKPEPRFNIAPSQDVAAMRVEDGQRILVSLHWGLIPFWAKDAKIAHKTINARVETAHQTPAFRAAFRNRRCLIPADGFYEWDKRGGTRQPYFAHRADEMPMALAGLWERWENADDEQVIESCTILTTEAAEPVARIHDRMPVILEPEDFDAWLDPEEHGVERLRKLLQPSAAGILAMYPVSRYVNKAGNEGIKCIEATQIDY